MNYFMSKYSIFLDMFFESDEQFNDVQNKIYDSCKDIFDNFSNITIKITKETDSYQQDYQYNSTETTTRHIKLTDDKYDF
jgi:hypothetical protein